MPGFSPTVIMAASITRAVGLVAPASIASTSPAASMAAARYKDRPRSRPALASVSFPRLVRRASTCEARGGSERSRGTTSARSWSRSKRAASAMRGSSNSGMTRRFFLPLIAALALSITLIGGLSYSRRSE
jgi:hypothetical protein